MQRVCTIELMKTLTFGKKMFLMLAVTALAAVAALANDPPQPKGLCDPYLCSTFGTACDCGNAGGVR